MTEAAIRALPLWQHSIEITPLGGGITNRNYVVEDGDARFVVRAADDQPALGIDRDNELTCSRFAHSLGVAPAVVHARPGICVFEFVDGATWTPESARAPAAIERAAARMRVVHGARVTGHLRYFCGFQVARTYLDLARAESLVLPPGADVLDRELDALQGRVGAFVPTLCHNDLMPGNFIDAGGDALWLIDWEYAGIGNPLFDLAGLSTNCEFDTACDARLLASYYGDASAAPRLEFAIYKAIAALRESLWAVVQGSRSDIDFDYDAYRDDNWEKFRRAVGRIDSSAPHLADS